MPGAHEVIEHMEHAAHAGGGHGGTPNKTGTYIGLSMAVLGVMLAFCSAMVGSARTELIKTMVEQSDAHAKYQSQNTKHRIAIMQLQAIHSSIPTHADDEKIDAEFVKLERELRPDPKPDGDKGKPAAVGSAATPAPASSTSETGLLLRATKIATDHIVRILAPEREDALRLVSLSRKYEKEVEASREWVESFEESIHGHTQAAEHYEWAQLSAEIGIVIASIALLMSSRRVWFVALALGAGSLAIIGWTYTSTHPHVEHGDHQIAVTGKAYSDLRKAQTQKHEDEALADDVDKAFGK